MIAFLHLILIVHLVQLGFGHDVVSVVEAVMANIVAERSYQNGEHILVVILCVFCQVLGFEDEVDMLGDVGSMDVIMVDYRSLVLVVNLAHELQVLVVVNEAL